MFFLGACLVVGPAGPAALVAPAWATARGSDFARPAPSRAAPRRATTPPARADAKKKQSANKEQQARATLVMLAGETAAQATVAQAVSRSVRAQLVGLGVRLRLHRVPRLPAELPSQLDLARGVLSRQGGLAAFWCELRPGPQLFVYLMPRGGDRLVLRRIRGLDAAARYEALGLILRQSVQALRSGGSIGVHPSRVRTPPPRRPLRSGRPATPGRPRPLPASRPLAPVQGDPTPAERHGVALEAAYFLEGLREGHVAHGFWAGLSWRFLPPWSAFLGLGVAPAVRAEVPQATLRLQRYAVGLGARGHLRWGRWRLGASACLALEYATFDVRSSVAQPYRDDDDLIVSLIPALHAEVRLISRLRLFAELGAAIYLNNPRYVLDGPAASPSILAPWPVRPRLLVGLAVGLF